PAAIAPLWQLVTGDNLPTPDFCTPKSSPADRIFVPGSAGGPGAPYHTVPGTATSIVTCTFPIPPGTASVVAQWNQYLDLPTYSGYVQFAEYRYFRDGVWSGWRNTQGGGTRRVESLQEWGG